MCEPPEIQEDPAHKAESYFWAAQVHRTPVQPSTTASSLLAQSILPGRPVRPTAARPAAYLRPTTHPDPAICSPPAAGTHDQQAAPIAGSILPAPPDLAVAGDPLSILPPWRGRGGLSMSRWNRPSSLAEYPPSGFPGGAEQVPPRSEEHT